MARAFAMVAAVLLLVASMQLVGSGCDKVSDCKSGQLLLDGKCQQVSSGDTSGGVDASPDTAGPDLASPDLSLVPDTSIEDTALQPDLNGQEDATLPDLGGDDAQIGVDTADVLGCTPPTFDPGPTKPWERGWISEGIVLLGSPNHRGQDVIANPEMATVLIGKFTYGGFAIDKDLKEEFVDTYLRLFSDPCNEFKLLGRRTTSTDGQYGTTYGFEDDGGRIFFEVPNKDLPPLGRHDVKMVVVGDHEEANFSFRVVKKKTQAVVFDIDGTLTTGDGELFKEIFGQLTGGYEPEMYADANTVVNLYASKGYLVIYLTGRPEMLHKISRAWLAKNKFPDGVVHLTDTESQALPFDSFVKAYKRDYLLFLKNTVGLEIVAAYGNASTDIDAYEEAGIDKAHTFIIGKNAGDKNTQPLTDYTSHLNYVTNVPAATVP